MIWMVTVVESRNVVTRLPVEDEVPARQLHEELRKRKPAEGWLSVTLSQVKEKPHRSEEEKARVIRLMYTYKENRHAWNQKPEA